MSAAMSTPSPRYIKAEHVLLALVTRKIAAMQVAHGERGSRWAAMSNGVNTQSCDRRRGAYRLPYPPLLLPMNHGELRQAVERTRLVGGLAEVRRTWGCGLRVLRAELDNHCLQAVTPC